MDPSHEPAIPFQPTTPDDSQAVHSISRWTGRPLYVASFLCLALVAVGFIYLDLREAYRDTLAYWEVRMSSSADERVSFANLWLSERRTDTEVIAHSSLSARLLSRAGSARALAETRQGEERELERMAGLNGFLGGAVADSECRIAAEAGVPSAAAAVVQETCRAVLNTGEFRVIVFDVKHPRVWLAFACPVFAAGPSSNETAHHALGVAVMIAEPWKHTFPFMASESEPQRTAQTLAVWQDAGKLVVFSPVLAMEGVDSIFRPPAGEPSFESRLARGAQLGFGEFTDYRGVQVLGAARPIGSTGASLVRKVDRNEALSEFHKRAVSESLAGALSVLLFGSVILALHRHRAARDVTERLRQEEALRQSEERYRTLFENATVGIYRTTRDGRVLAANPALVRMLGYETFEQLSTRNLEEKGFEPRYSRWAFHQQMECDGIIKGLESAWLKRDGSTVFIRESAKAIRDDHGPVMYYDGVVEDISERKRAEEALREGEARFQTVFDSVQTGIFIIDPESHRIVDANPVALATVGVAREQALGAECQQFICPAEKGRCPITDLGQTVDSSERILLAAGGRNRTVLKNVVPVVISGRQHLLESFVDITERKRTEEALHLAQFSVEHASDAVFWTDPQGRIVYANNAACRSLGYSREELLSLSIPEVDPLFPKEAWANFWEEVKRCGSKTIETQHRTKQQRVFPVEITATYLQFEGKEYSFAFARDITKRKCAEAELAEQLRFETLLADLSARFVNVPADQLDCEIEDAQRRVCECLELDVSTLWEASIENPSVLTLTHLYRPLGGPPFPERMDAHEYFPWSYGQLLTRKEMVVAISSLKELPAEATRDRDSWRQYDMQSALVVGLSVGRRPPVGALSFNTVRTERVWPGKIVNRLQLVAQMFTNALERQRSDRALRESEEKYRITFQNIPAGVVVIEADGSISMMNAEAARLSGYSRSGLATTQLVDWESSTIREDGSPCAVADLPVSRCFRTGEPQADTVLGVRRPDGSIFYSVYSASPVLDTVSGKVVRVVLAYRDITEQKQAERRQGLAVEVLDILNRAGGKSETIREILRVVKAYGGYEAVGIRLREGEDFPYFVQEGFSAEFVQRENFLCSRLPDGTILRDEEGQPILECSCGLVLRGRTDPTNPLFTPGGSCWTNGASSVLALPSGQDPRPKLRNRCFSQGHESVALIPIRVGEQIVGLVQLNDRRSDRFTLDTIRFLEGIGASIGLGLSRWREAEALRQSEQFNREVISNAQEGVAVYDREFRYIVWNPFLEDLTGMPAARVLGKEAFDLFPHLRDYHAQSLLRRVLEGETVQSPDMFFRVAETGKSGWVSATYSPHVDADGEIVGVVGMIHEITKRKQAEEALRERELQLSLFVRHSPAAIAMLDREMRYLVVSRRWTSDYRLGKRDIHGLSHYEVFPEIPDRWKEIHRRCLAGAVESCEEDPFPHQDGTLDWVRWEVRPWRRVDGSIGGIIIFSENITERRQTREELQRSLNQVRALAGRLQSVREEESKRLAREIHDQLGQALTALRLDFNSLISELPGGPQPPPKRASSILKLVDDTIQSVRRISSQLRPGMLDDLGLAPTVEWAGEDFEARTGIKCRLDLPHKDFAINSGLATAVYRILQEALTNVARHADATEVDVRLSEEERDLVLLVHDNGKGMPADKLANTESLGILGMQERALIFGGDVIVGSSPGMGTTVRVKIPENRA